jgi:FecR protein
LSRRSCSRKWQVEATRDGRLRGKDLETALRHQDVCPECAQEASELGGLGCEIAELPQLARDSLTARRSRQSLLAALNETILEPPRYEVTRRVSVGIGLAVAAAVSWVVFARTHLQRGAAHIPQSIVEVRAASGARWSESVDAQMDRVAFARGSASFTVHPHPGRRVVIQLPDGELEDMGTVFELRVSDQHTEHIAVSKGRVTVRIRTRPEFSLRAGQAWEAEPPAMTTRAAPVVGDGGAGHPTGVEPPSNAPTTGSDRAAHSSSSHSLAHIGTRTAPARPAETSSEPSSVEAVRAAQSAKAEDAAYLRIVELLGQARYAQARGQARAYLLRFPNGFRRIEVLNIATRSGDVHDDAAGQ